MNSEAQIITNFYTAFQNKDYKSMQASYAENAVFSDPVFPQLNASEVKAMWEMFCVKSQDLDIKFSNVQSNDKIISADWTATYLFSATKKRVVNHIHAEFKFENGKIVDHRDKFNFYNWAKQALGWSGLLLGWTPIVLNKVRKMAAKSLNQYMQKAK